MSDGLLAALATIIAAVIGVISWPALKRLTAWWDHRKAQRLYEHGRPAVPGVSAAVPSEIERVNSLEEAVSVVRGDIQLVRTELGELTMTVGDLNAMVKELARTQKMNGMNTTNQGDLVALMAQKMGILDADGRLAPKIPDEDGSPQG